MSIKNLYNQKSYDSQISDLRAENEKLLRKIKSLESKTKKYKNLYEHEAKKAKHYHRYMTLADDSVERAKIALEYAINYLDERNRTLIPDTKEIE